MVKCIVIDDQKSAIDVIANHIEKEENFQLMGIFTDPIEVLNFLQKKNIDLVFASMETPGLDGIESMENWLSKQSMHVPKFVLITEQKKYVVNCFDAGIKGYLAKLINFKHFDSTRDALIPDNLSPVSRNSFFFADVDGSKVKINFSDIVYFESVGNYVKIIGNKIKTVIHKSLGSIMQILPSNDFIRVHKSYIVSINYIVSYKAGELKFSINDSIIKIPTGTTFRKELLKKLEIV